MNKWLRVLAFFAPILLTIYLLRYVVFVYLIIASIELLFIKVFNKSSSMKHNWSGAVIYSIDQTYNVVWRWWYNWTQKPDKHLFGHPDETVSSVVGKNLHLKEHWTIINKILTFILDKNKGNHGIRSIEDDEGYTK